MKKEISFIAILIFAVVGISSTTKQRPYISSTELIYNLKNDSATSEAVDTLIVSYKEHIQPIWDQRCTRCHNLDNDEVSISLTYDVSYRYLSYYKYFNVKEPKKSHVYDVTVGDTQNMPPEGEGYGLTPEEGKLLLDWITQGAKNN